MYFGYGILYAGSLKKESLNSSVLTSLALFEEGSLAMLCGEIEEGLGATQESMRRYTDTLCQVIRQTTVIPLRFGTLFDKEEEIRQVLKKEKKAYTRLLQRLDNKIEIELKVWWKKECFSSTMLKNKRLSKWKKALEQGDGQGFDVVEFGKAIQEVADHERLELGKAFLASLRPLAAENLIKEPTDEYQAFDGVFLVERQNEEAFDQAVGVLYGRYSENMMFKYTGPWAPHHFINAE